MSDITKIDLKDKKPLILVGNPNVGKSVVFGLLTDTYATVSNYPGTTVEVTTAVSSFAHHQYYVIDTPGINSLIPYSEDERVSRDILCQYTEKTVVHVFDTKNFVNNMLLTFLNLS
mgnify:CR=1 FL=1